MADLKVSEYNPHKSPYGPRLSDEEWERFKPVLVGLDKTGLPRKKIAKAAAEEYGFRGTYAALNARFKIWGLTNPRTNSPAVLAVIPSLDMATPTISYKGVDQEAKTPKSNGASAFSNHDGSEEISATESPMDEDSTDREYRRVRYLAPPDPVGQSVPIAKELIGAEHHSSDVEAAYEAVSHGHTFTDSTDMPTLNTILENTSLEAASARDASNSNAAETSAPFSILSVSKRPRSQVSSLRCSSSRSSDTRSFFRYAKRLRQVPITKSKASSIGGLSWVSSHESQSFEVVTGYGSALDILRGYNVKQESFQNTEGAIVAKDAYGKYRASDTKSYHDTRIKEDFSLLYSAGLLGCDEYLRVILSDPQTDVNAQGGEYGNALQAALAWGHEKVVQLLLERGADVNAQGGKYGNALQTASVRAHEKIVQLLVDAGADVNAQGGEYGNALQAASARGHEKIVQMLLDAGADADAQEGEYRSALRAASHNGHDKVVQILLDAGADVNAQAGKYSDALQAASYIGHEKVVQMLLDAGADVNAQGSWYGNALQPASARGHEKIVQMLLDAGADANAQETGYGSALLAASYNGHDKVVQMLLDAGADVNAQERWYGNALQAASALGHEKIVQMLLDAGADANAQEGLYGSAMRAASFKCHEKVVQILLDAGVDVNAQ